MANSLNIWRHLAFAIGLTAGMATGPHALAQTAPKATLKPFETDEAFRAFVKKTLPPIPARKSRERSADSDASVSPPPPPPAPSAAPQSVTVSGTKSESITNTQEQGVDEGGIVKNFGDYLVILRRGRLFTVSVADRSLTPIDHINAFPPGVDGSGSWYDEMLIAGNRVIVVGYSYSRGGTEVNRFRIDNRGRLSFEDAYHLRSNDYYSSRNYASRLIGNRLIMYTPLYLPYEVTTNDSFGWLPAVREWRGRNEQDGFKPMLDGRRVYLPPNWTDPERSDIAALHTVVNCDLGAQRVACEATSILGPRGRNFYVSANAVYVWVSQFGRAVEGRRAQAGMLYRLPLDGSAPSAIGVRGSPTDQFSFREDWSEGRLNVLVRAQGGGDAMWNPEFKSGAVALLQVRLSDFGDGSDLAPREDYRGLPSPGEGYYGFQNRFVGNYVLYGGGNSWGRPKDQGSTLYAAAVRGRSVVELPLTHGIDRIEVMGRDAVVIGADSRDLHFQAVTLQEAWQPKLGSRYTLPGATQGETRSHAFYFKPEPSPGDPDAGLLGLPVARPARPAYKQLLENSAAIIFLERAAGQFNPLGELGAQDEGVRDDGCEASCVDWYGNARPIFMQGRIFALMGYELVEVTRARGAIRETRRITFAPGTR
ncbi:MAG TPA: hypothetical protein DCL48_06185 [Alphaproteobacteria bacterium]|nr:hypothetical protein [Alphaproteobacteria bacterium]